MTHSSAVGRRHNAIVFNSKPFIFARFPTEIVRLVFEASVTPGLRAGDEQQRQRTAYTYCLISKGVRVWVEPLLYENVVMESRMQVKRFLRALEIKPASFLVRAVKTVWMLNEHFPPESSDQLHIIFIKCPLLKRFAILDDWNYIRILHNIPKPQSGIYALQELTIVRASADFAKTLTLPYLTIQKLILIDCAEIFFDIIHRRALEDKELLDTLRAIPQIYLKFITIPNVRLVYHLKFRSIPLWIQPSPSAYCIYVLPPKRLIQSSCMVSHGTLRNTLMTWTPGSSIWRQMCKRMEADLLCTHYQMRKWVAMQRPSLWSNTRHGSGWTSVLNFCAITRSSCKVFSRALRVRRSSNLTHQYIQIVFNSMSKCIQASTHFSNVLWCPTYYHDVISKTRRCVEFSCLRKALFIKYLMLTSVPLRLPLYLSPLIDSYNSALLSFRAVPRPLVPCL